MTSLILFILNYVLYFLHISALPVQDVLETNHERTNSDFTFIRTLDDFNYPPRNMGREPLRLSNENSLASKASLRKNKIYGYHCRDKFYPISYLKRVAAFGALKFAYPSVQQYPMEIRRGLYIYPLHPDLNTFWVQGKPEGLDRVVFDSKGKAFHAVTLSDHPGFDVRRSYQKCISVQKALPHVSGKSSIFSRYPPSTAHGVENRLDTLAKEPPIPIT